MSGGSLQRPPTLRGVDEAVERAARLADHPLRGMLGIVGPPGAGKSTLATAVAEALGGRGAVVPMDGFHLANSVLIASGRREWKGRLDTFDGWGYLRLLQRLRAEHDRTVFAPAFDRALEEPVAGSIEVSSAVRLVITEGNYLLDPSEPWASVRAELDEVWYCDVDEEVRLARLVERHVRFGKPLDLARRWVATVDQPNASSIAAHRDRADCWVVLE